MASPKKNKSKTSKSRPAATASVSQPVVEDASYLTALSAFSPDGNLFSYLSLAIDKHRLRIYNTATGQSEAEYIADSARVSALAWCEFLEKTSDDDSVPTKKRRKSQSGEDASQRKKKTLLVGLGLSNGTVIFFSPTHGRALWTLSHSSSTSPILSIVSVTQKDDLPNVWTSGADGVVRLWDVHKNELLGSWKNDDRIPYSSMTARPRARDDTVEILAASHSIRLLSTDSDISSKKLRELASFTGHSSSVKSLQWDASQTPSQRFVSMAEADRVVSIWEVPHSTSQGHIIASVQLDSDARAISLTSSSTPSKSTLLTLSASGRICIYPIPEELTSENSRKSQKLPTLLPRSTLTTSSKNATPAQIVAASFVEQEPGRVRVARIVEGVRPVFNVVRFQDETGNFVSEIVIEDIKPGSVDSVKGAPNNRYTASSTIAVGSGAQIGLDVEMDELAEKDTDGELDVDLAELSLGQRLTALSGANALPEGSEDDDEDDDEGASSKKRKAKATTVDISVVPAASLTRTLIQALHSSDTKLLEMCLAHSDQILIRNTVRRLPPQLAIPLVTACVERLGRGARGGSMKGGGGGASSQRGTGLITWVKTTLVVHSGHLMTMPDLVARLAGLHATLTSRLALQESLLNLGGRLDMVLSQIEMRSSVAPAPLGPKSAKQVASKKKAETTHYVEGESEEEEEEEEKMDVDVEVESEDDDGSIEDVDLGGSSDTDDEDDEEEEDEEEDDDDDEEEPTMNGFIDDEAEEEFTDDEEGDDSE